MRMQTCECCKFRREWWNVFKALAEWNWTKMSWLFSENTDDKPIREIFRERERKRYLKWKTRCTFSHICPADVFNIYVTNCFRKLERALRGITSMIIYESPHLNSSLAGYVTYFKHHWGKKFLASVSYAQGHEFTNFVEKRFINTWGLRISRECLCPWKDRHDHPRLIPIISKIR